MRVIITGGTGLIGRELAADLLSDGHEVIILSRNPQAAKDIPAGAQVEKWDAHSANGWGHLADGADAIVNFAGANLAGEHFFPTHWTDARRKLLRDSRLDAGKAVIEAVRAAQQKPGAVLQSSAIGYYGVHDPQVTLMENDPPGDGFLAKLCVDWEAATAEVEQMGVRRMVIRSGVVLSTKGGAFTRLLLPFKLFAGGPLGNGRQIYSWIHIADEVAAIRALIENSNAHGVYNLTAPNPVSNGEMAKAIGRVMRRPSFFPVPGFAMRLLFGEVASVVLEGQRVLPQRLQKANFKFRFPELESALRNLLMK